jgi:ATP-dependent helicase/nuclease subunit A
VTAAVPADADARTRLLRELDRTLFVEAGAGTGKTTQLVGRIVHLVVSGELTDIAELAAITFTESAAAELRHRVRERLERERVDHGPTSVESARIDRALDRIDEATISTLHGFAARLLSDFPVEAGLPPGFEVADEIAAEVIERERWAELLDDLFADPGLEPVLRRALQLGLTLRHLDEVNRAFADNWDRMVGLVIADHGLAGVDIGAVLGAVDAAVKCAEGCGGGAKSVEKTLAELPAFRDRLLGEPDPEQQLLVLLHEQPVFPKFGGARKPELVELKGCVEGVRAAIDAQLRALRLDALEPLLVRLRDHTLAGVVRRRHDGQVRFHDLLVLARDLLAQHPEARRQLARRHRLLLIDEFQDTDPLQVEIALLLGLADPSVAPADWSDAVVGEGRLFFVGDPKQSIYRFRRADIGVFERARDRFSGAGLRGPNAETGPVELTVNFRTVPSVLRWVNAVFGELIGPDDEPGQPAYRALDAARDDHGDQPGVSLLGDEIDHPSVAALREHEARHLAEVIAGIPEGDWPVMDRTASGGDGPRPARFGDVTVLLPTRAVLGELERAFEARGVPYRIESRSLVFGTDEVRELLAVLQAVDDPADAVAVIAALRSPGLACADDALARYRMAGGRWNPRAPVPDWLRAALGDDDPVLAGLATLARLHDARLGCPVNELVARVVRELSLVELTTARRRPRDHWRRIRMVLDEARAFVEAGGEALSDFVAHIEQQADERASRVESIVSDADDDAVRIVTIHGAKGLEYPIVALAGLGGEYRPPYDRVLWTPSGPEIALGRQDGERFETAGYAAARGVEEQLDRAERVRLLYVAATRARDHLIVSLHRRPRPDSSAKDLAKVVAGLSDTDAGGRPWQRWLPAAAPAPPAGGPVEPGLPGAAATDGTDALHAWEEERRALLDSVTRLSVTTPTALAAAAAAAARLPSEPAADAETGVAADRSEVDAVRPDVGSVGVDDDAVAAGGGGAEVEDAGLVESDAAGDDVRVYQFGRRGHGGTAMGRAVHGTLQMVDLADPEPTIGAVAAHQAAAEGMGDQAATVEALARSALAAPAVGEARAGRRWWRELFVSAPLGRGTLVEGYVDLLYETVDGRLVVVDYKTDQARDGAGLDVAADRYRLQGAAYAAVIGQVLGRPVDRCVFVFARSGGGAAVEREITDLPVAVGEVVAMLT